MKAFKITVEIIKDCIFNIISFIENNLMNFARILNFLLPYIMFYLGIKNINNPYILILPIAFFILIGYNKAYANKIGKGTTIPIPRERFTKLSDDGEVSIAHDRLQELILYIADVEDWLERHNYM